MDIILVNLKPDPKYVDPETVTMKAGDIILFSASKTDAAKTYVVTIPNAGTYFDSVTHNLTYILKAGELAKTPSSNTATDPDGIEYSVQIVSADSTSVNSDAPPRIIIKVQ